MREDLAHGLIEEDSARPVDNRLDSISNLGIGHRGRVQLRH